MQFRLAVRCRVLRESLRDRACSGQSTCRRGVGRIAAQDSSVFAATSGGSKVMRLTKQYNVRDSC
jgi:hypothetical protein